MTTTRTATASSWPLLVCDISIVKFSEYPYLIRGQGCKNVLLDIVFTGAKRKMFCALEKNAGRQCAAKKYASRQCAANKYVGRQCAAILSPAGMHFGQSMFAKGAAWVVSCHWPNEERARWQSCYSKSTEKARSCIRDAAERQMEPAM
jgi:hypothetical protein